MKKAILFISMIIITINSQSQTSGTLTVTATTSKTSTPEYTPKNIVAFWIEDSNGLFVKTLLAYADERKQYLKNWRAKTTIAGSVYNSVDAITGPTQLSHTARTASWNGKNKSSILVADGTYKLKMEVTDNDGVVQNLAEIAFTKGATEQILTPGTTNGFSNITIKWSPVNTAIDEIKHNSPYQVYATNATNTVFISGLNIKLVEITDINGKAVLKTTKTTISVLNLPKGIYFANIITDSGNHIRKFLR